MRQSCPANCRQCRVVQVQCCTTGSIYKNAAHPGVLADAFEIRPLRSDNCCHELNLFVYQRDRSFFEQAVRPFLRNKCEKSVVDLVLLGDREQLRPLVMSVSLFTRLNVLEKVFLLSLFSESTPPRLPHYLCHAHTTTHLWHTSYTYLLPTWGIVLKRNDVV